MCFILSIGSFPDTCSWPSVTMKSWTNFCLVWQSHRVVCCPTFKLFFCPRRQRLLQVVEARAVEKARVLTLKSIKHLFWSLSAIHSHFHFENFSFFLFSHFLVYSIENKFLVNWKINFLSHKLKNQNQCNDYSVHNWLYNKWQQEKVNYDGWVYF